MNEAFQSNNNSSQTARLAYARHANMLSALVEKGIAYCDQLASSATKKQRAV
jgi:hypothetical protein